MPKCCPAADARLTRPSTALLLKLASERSCPPLSVNKPFATDKFRGPPSAEDPMGSHPGPSIVPLTSWRNWSALRKWTEASCWLAAGHADASGRYGG